MYDNYDPSYETCKGCPRRKVGCHNAEYCPGWGYREKQKEKRYEESRQRAHGTPDMSPYQKRLIYKKTLRMKKGGKE